MIEAHEISKSFGRVRAVERLSLELPAGQIAGLLGPNGAGKTTTIRMITGYLPPDTGRVVVGGFDLARDAGRARRGLGYLPESAPLYPEMSVQGYLHYRGRLFGMDRRERAKAIERVVDRCGLGPVRRRRIGQLSKGYRQRVGLAAALLHDPPALILDEPTNGLDPSQIREARSLIRELAEDRTMLVSSHILPEIERTCDRVIVIAGGRIRADGTPGELIEMAPGDGACVLEARGAASAEAGAAALAAAPGVSRVTHGPTGDGWTRFRAVAAEARADLRAGLASAAAGAGMTVRELRRERATLEEVFVHLMDEGSGRGPG